MTGAATVKHSDIRGILVQRDNHGSAGGSSQLGLQVCHGS